MRFLKKLFLYHHQWSTPYTKWLLRIIDFLTVICSVLVLIGVFFQIGFEVSPDDQALIFHYYSISRYVYLLYILFHIIFEPHENRKKFKKIFWILSALLYISAIPLIVARPLQNEIFITIWDWLNNGVFHVVLLAAFSIFQLSNSVVRMFGKRTNPSLILAISFLIIIIIGSVFLKMPRCTFNGISWIDSIFTATSAVCVTGLTSVNVAETFTTIGFSVILILIQIGGLGVMTLTSFFAMFFMGNTSLYNQLVMKDMVSSNSLGSSILNTLLYVLLFTVVIEAAGAISIWWCIHGTLNMTLSQEIYFSVFHSISAFCNAGFSTLPDNLGNVVLMQHQSFFYIIISLLVIFGGIGFPILVNFKEILKYELLRIWGRFKNSFQAPHIKHLFNLNTKIVLWTTFWLLVLGTLTIAFFEWNNAFAELSTTNKWIHAFFNATLPRTAGFSSINPVHFSAQSLLIIILLMWIGGGSQSTAGGIKVNAFAVSMLNLVTVARGGHRVEIFNREITNDSIRRSNATIIVSLAILFIAFFLLTILEPNISRFNLAFECFSALGTVGSSLNTTMLLCNSSKIIITILMFIGRIGLITLLMGIFKPTKGGYRFPYENIIIN
ncbi:MAG: potassium transporter TrkG [Bacteroidales bacterium]|nr:potassium transporter TrkG [Bacteroidales bacterium]